MSIPIHCAECGARGTVPEKFADKRVRCPRCGQAVEVAAAVGPPVSSSSLSTPAAPPLRSVPSPLESPPQEVVPQGTVPASPTPSFLQLSLPSADAPALTSPAALFDDRIPPRPPRRRRGSASSDALIGTLRGIGHVCILVGVVVMIYFLHRISQVSRFMGDELPVEAIIGAFLVLFYHVAQAVAFYGLAQVLNLNRLSDLDDDG